METSRTTRLTASDRTALEARRIYGGDSEVVEALAERGAEGRAQERNAVINGTGSRGRVRG